MNISELSIRSLMERIVTVTGDAVANPRNFRVPIGMSYQELLDVAEGFKQDPEKIICGGPMMGFGMFDLNVPTTKTSTALLALTQDDVSAMEPSPCINCGRCVEACPGRIVPSESGATFRRNSVFRARAALCRKRAQPLSLKNRIKTRTAPTGGR